MFCHVQFFTLNVHISIWFCMGFCHAHLCTNDYPYSYGFSSSTSLYEWLSILFFYEFSSCTSLYEWLSIFLWVFVMHIFVWMTIHFFVYGFSSCTFLYEWLSIFIFFSSCTFLYEWLSLFLFNGFLSCTFMYEWLSIYFEWVFVMHHLYHQ